ncbi:MAG TPA: hypothetical protein VLA06_03270 [Woeseiaceae bacterium]|nr:hypothetical protein [Woeseiaceae bacterium]
MRKKAKACRHISPAESSLTSVIAGCVLAILAAGQAVAESPGVREEAAWYEGELVIRLAKLNDPDTVDSPVKVPAAVQNPFYIVASAGVGLQEHPVIGVVPGDPGYSSWWKQLLVFDVSAFFGPGRDVTVSPYTSAAEIEAALCELKGGFSVFGPCFAMGKPLVDISDAWLPENLGPLNAQILRTPPALGVCTPD